jgi:PhoPQ-activated pathogenicity-related protein
VVQSHLELTNMTKRSLREPFVYWHTVLPFFLIGLVVARSSWAEAGAAPGPEIAAHLRATQNERTALDNYVAAPDTNYSYRLVSTVRGQDQTTYILEMTSQAWLTTNEVDRPVWKHWMIIVRPDAVASSKAMLLIAGGANDGRVPKSADGNLVRIALATKSVVAELKMVPNQPLVFAGETEGRKEDSLIAYTWDKFLRTGDAKWPARLPMTKAAVRALDTVTAFCASPEGGQVKVDGFVVAGGSKRGWTTWTTAAVDKRVVGIIPIVIDVLNIEPSMLHHYAAYGFWAPAIENYSAFRIMDWNGTPEYHALMKIVEPYQYRHRFTMPKFIMNASGDQFFLPDSSQFYFNDLPGVKYLRYVPNADHSLKGSDAYETLEACYNAVLYNLPLPQFSWTLEKDGAIRVTTKDTPSAVKLWQATNPDARDFRLETLGPVWQSMTLADQGGGVYLAKVPKPPKGWTAFFVELTFKGGNASPPFKFTTQVRVVPDVLPYKFVPKGRPQ